MEKGSIIKCSWKNVVAMSSVVHGDKVEEGVEAHCCTKDSTLLGNPDGTSFSYEESASIVFGTSLNRVVVGWKLGGVRWGEDIRVNVVGGGGGGGETSKRVDAFMLLNEADGKKQCSEEEESREERDDDDDGYETRPEKAWRDSDGDITDMDDCCID
jgi:hypothetical protein